MPRLVVDDFNCTIVDEDNEMYFELEDSEVFDDDDISYNSIFSIGKLGNYSYEDLWEFYDDGFVFAKEYLQIPTIQKEQNITDEEWFDSTLEKAKQNDASANNQIGKAYLIGFGCKRDVIKSLIYFERAYELDNVLYFKDYIIQKYYHLELGDKPFEIYRLLKDYMLTTQKPDNDLFNLFIAMSLDSSISNLTLKQKIDLLKQYNTLKPNLCSSKPFRYRIYIHANFIEKLAESTGEDVYKLYFSEKEKGEEIDMFPEIMSIRAAAKRILANKPPHDKLIKNIEEMVTDACGFKSTVLQIKEFAKKFGVENEIDFKINVDENNWENMVYLGTSYASERMDVPIKHNYAKARNYLEKAIRIATDKKSCNYVEACMCLGDLYMSGKLGQKDVGKGIEYYKLAGKKGLERIGLCYLYGAYLETDFSKAIEYLEEGNSNPNGFSFALAYAYWRTGNYKKLKAMCDKAKNDEAAYYNFAEILPIMAALNYSSNTYDETKNKLYSKYIPNFYLEDLDYALKSKDIITTRFLSKLAELICQVLPDSDIKCQACYALAYCYKKGIGVKQSYKKEFELLHSLFERDDIFYHALPDLIDCYKYGLGVKQNLVKANNLARLYKAFESSED